jgi:hypothetical protein
MGLKRRITLAKEATTTDNSTWVTLVQVPVPASPSDSAISLSYDIIAQRQDNKEAGQHIGYHRAKREASVLSLVRDRLGVVGFSSSTPAVGGLDGCDVRFNISGDNIQLQVKGLSGVSIDWYGELKALMK